MTGIGAKNGRFTTSEAFGQNVSDAEHEHGFAPAGTDLRGGIALPVANEVQRAFEAHVVERDVFCRALLSMLAACMAGRCGGRALYSPAALFPDNVHGPRVGAGTVLIQRVCVVGVSRSAPVCRRRLPVANLVELVAELVAVDCGAFGAADSFRVPPTTSLCSL